MLLSIVSTRCIILLIIFSMLGLPVCPEGLLSIACFPNWLDSSSRLSLARCVKLHKSFCKVASPIPGKGQEVLQCPMTDAWFLFQKWLQSRLKCPVFWMGQAEMWSRTLPSYCMLWGPQEWGVEKEKNMPIEIYMDFILKNNLHQYCVFIEDLFEKGMLPFTSHPRDLISPFFVAKKSGKLRLVLDCRAVKQRFRPPPRVALAAGYSWSRLHIPEGETLFTAQSDIRNYFYSMSLPAELRELFCLSHIPHSLLLEWQVPFERTWRVLRIFRRLGVAMYARGSNGVELGNVDSAEYSH